MRTDLTPYGVVKDTNPLDVGDEYTSIQNMRFSNLATEKMGGEDVLTTTLFEPYFLLFNGDNFSPGWFYMGDGQIGLFNGTHYDISATLSSGVNWNASLFNNNGVFNNEVDVPYYFPKGSNPVVDNVVAIPNWPSTWRCNSIRPYKSFLIAMNIEDTGDREETRIIWSNSSDAGALPPDWNIADPASLAGDAYLTSTKGEIIDGLQLRDLFAIYKSHSTSILRLIQGQAVMRIDKIQINSGILAKNCVTEFKGRHFVVSDADIVLFDGQNLESIADKRVRAEIFSNIDVNNFRNSYVVRYDRRNEIWVCYPTTGNEIPNRAAVWHWRDNVWTFRDLIRSRHISSGLANFAAPRTWDNVAGTWDNVAGTWSPTSANPTTDTLVSANNSRLGVFDDSFTVYGGAFSSLVEKATMDLGEPSRIKYVNSVIPRITAQDGTQVFIRIGTQFKPDDPISFSPERTFTVGQDREAHFTEKGRYITVRMRSEGDWICHGFGIEFRLAGKH